MNSSRWMRQNLIPLLLICIFPLIASGVASYADYRVNSAAGTITTLKSTDAAGISTPHVIISSGAVTSTPSGTQDVNNIQINGVALSVGNGVTNTGTQRVTLSSDSTGVVGLRGSNFVDRSGTITAGVTAQDVAASLATRRGFLIQNNSVGDLWFNTLAAAIVGQPSIKIVAGGYFETPPGASPTGAISIIGATTGQAFSVREW
jgi:hypothetical protein